MFCFNAFPWRSQRWECRAINMVDEFVWHKTVCRPHIIYTVLKPHVESQGRRDELLERKMNRLQRTVDSSLQSRMRQQVVQDSEKAVRTSSVVSRLTGVGSLFGLHLTKEKSMRGTRHFSQEHKEQAMQLFTFLNNGILLLATGIQHDAISYSRSKIRNKIVSLRSTCTARRANVN